MLLSVVICTRNRPRSLERALRSIVESAQNCDRQKFEVLVIDNGGSLDTARLQKDFGQYFNLRIEREDRPGLSYARNHGLSRARGDWILWTDDDVSVSSHWLPAYFAAIERFPDACVMGGPILPSFEGQPPQWLVAGQQQLRTAFASRNPDDVKIVFQKGDSIPWGANFAVQKSMAMQFPFDTSLGRHPRWPTRGGEESAVIRKLLEAGGTGHWLREASVLHHIDSARQTKRYIRAFFFDVGHRNSVLDGRQANRLTALRKLLVALYRAAGNEARYRISGIDSAQKDLALNLRHAAKNWGAVKAWLQVIVSGPATDKGDAANHE